MMKKTKAVAAYLTVWLSMTLGVMTSLYVALLEGVRLNAIEMEATCITDLCMDNVLAEYHRELFRRYNVLALDSSYGTTSIGRGNLEGRLAWYLACNLSAGKEKAIGPLSKYMLKDFLGMSLGNVTITDFSLLPDWDGSVFRKKAVEAIQDDLGIVAIQNTLNWMKTVQDYQLDTRDVEEEKAKVDEKIASYQGREIEGKKEPLSFDNPTSVIENTKKTGLLWQVLGSKSVSGKKIDQSGLIQKRSRDRISNHGNMGVEEQNALQKKGELLIFDEYLLSYFGNYLGVKEQSALDYEVEYVIAGKSTDAENLRGVLKRILAMREASNATYLFSDQTKCEEVEVVALALSAVIGEPELKDLFKTTILLGWAYVESIYDLKVLMNGKRVPLMKDKNTWHYDFSGILEGLWDSVVDGGHEEGLGYEDYLRVLLSLSDAKEITERAMNVIEAIIRLTPGNKNFRMDACYVRFGINVIVNSGFGYQAEISEEKGY